MDRHENTPHTAAEGRRMVLVAGAGRSGTSTVAGSLAALGLRVPKPEVPPDDSNPRGFFEPRWVVDFHDQLLRQAGVKVADARPHAWSMAERRGSAPDALQTLRQWLVTAIGDDPAPALIKDPRLAWFVGPWLQLGEELGVQSAFITMLRHPAQVVGSRRRNYNAKLQDPHGVATWLNATLGTELRTRNHPRVFVSYDDLLADWRGVLVPLIDQLGLRAATNVSASASVAVDAFIDPDLRRVERGWVDLAIPPRLLELARQTWEVLESEAVSRATVADPQASATLDSLREAFGDYYAECESVAHSSVVAPRAREPRPAAPAVGGSVATSPSEPTLGGRLKALLRRTGR